MGYADREILKGMMKLVMISDTHEKRPTDIPDGDVLIHAGDFTMSGRLKYLSEELTWFKSLPHRHKIWVAGNHDWACQHFMTEKHEDLLREASAPAIYLRDSGVTIDGRFFYGSPWQPWFCDWAFNLQRGAEIKKKWDIIPNDVDVLITHGPPKHILDWVGRDAAGCEELAKAVNGRVMPKVHVFGHIHGAYGYRNYGRTHYFNASMVNEGYQLDPKHKAWEFEL